MKNVLKPFLFSMVGLFGAAQFVDGFSFGNDITVLAFAALVFGAVNSLLRPILKTVTIPLNFLTLGLSSVVIDVLLFYLTTRVVPGLTVTAFRFGGFQLELPSQYPNVTISAFEVPVWGTLLLSSIVVSVFMIILETIFGDE